MPTQVVNDELIDLLRPWFCEKPCSTDCPWKLCSPDGLTDPVVYTDNAGDFYVTDDMFVDWDINIINGALYTDAIDTYSGDGLSIENCYSVSCRCTIDHDHGGAFSVLDRLWFAAETVINNVGWTTIYSIGNSWHSGVIIVNGCTNTNTANVAFQAMVYFTYTGPVAGIVSTIEYKVGAANGQLQISGTVLQAQALNLDLTMVSVIVLESRRV